MPFCHPVADPESFVWVGTQYRNSAPQYATVLATVLRYIGHRKSGVVLGLFKTRLGPPLLPPPPPKKKQWHENVGIMKHAVDWSDMFRWSRYSTLATCIICSKLKQYYPPYQSQLPYLFFL
jgi:hypothetical protein